jgi:hypothetical protein
MITVGLGRYTVKRPQSASISPLLVLRKNEAIDVLRKLWSGGADSHRRVTRSVTSFAKNASRAAASSSGACSAMWWEE